MRLHSLLAAAALLSVSLIARADTYTVFNLTSTFNASGTKTVDGTITLDTTTDSFSSADLVTAGFLTSPDTLNDIVSQGAFGHPPVENVVISDGFLTGLNLYLPVQSLANYSGGSICLFGTSGCKFDGTTYNVFIFGTAAVSGSLTPDVAPTPEPSSLVLLGTGLIGAAGALRRRLA